MAESATEEPAGKRVKVAVVGGGCAGLTVAWELSSQPGYEVHVYEKSWRLGGKGASGRDDQGRIQEHGLHVWLGFYENTFKMMRACYDEVRANGWGPHSTREEDRLPHGSMDEAFFPEPNVGVVVRNPTPDRDDPTELWHIWGGNLPPAAGEPGEQLDEETNPFTIANYTVRCLQLLKALMHSVIGRSDEPDPGGPRPEERSALDEALEQSFNFDPTQSPKVLVDWAARLLRGGALTTAGGLLQAVTIIETVLQKFKLAPEFGNTVLQFMEAVAAQARKQLRDLVAVDPALRRKTEIIDIVMTIAVGLYRDRVLFDKHGLDAINHIDYRTWLLQHGATRSAVDSPFITGIYDLTFAYRDGDRSQPALAAGVALRGALRMFFTYRGSMFWRMRSGMGDAMFAPLYKVLLKRKNVRFHFRHTLRKVEFQLDHPPEHVAGLTFETPRSRNDIDALGEKALDAAGCWPNDDRQFRAKDKNPSGETFDLKVGDDFDAVVFAMGVDDFVLVCERSDFFNRVPETWLSMRNNVKTVATQAAQVWMNKSLDELGWHRGAGIFTRFGAPFETWADMTHTLTCEADWRQKMSLSPSPADGAQSVAYFCAALEGYGDATAATGRNVAGGKLKAHKQVEKNLEEVLKHGMRPFWPAAYGPRKSAWNNRIGTPYVAANIEGSERYTLSLPGSIEHRISPLDRTVLNMTIAGDWTACGLDAGCVESAVMSGKLAAFAITNEHPPLNSIVGYDHP